MTSKTLQWAGGALGAAALASLLASAPAEAATHHPAYRHVAHGAHHYRHVARHGHYPHYAYGQTYSPGAGPAIAGAILGGLATAGVAASMDCGYGGPGMYGGCPYGYGYGYDDGYYDGYAGGPFWGVGAPTAITGPRMAILAAGPADVPGGRATAACGPERILRATPDSAPAASAGLTWAASAAPISAEWAILAEWVTAAAAWATSAEATYREDAGDQAARNRTCFLRPSDSLTTPLA